jgi:hypothetical protein
VITGVAAAVCMVITEAATALVEKFGAVAMAFTVVVALTGNVAL